MLQWVALHLAVGFAGTWVALRYAQWRDLIDHPGERRSHHVATARGGGAAIVAALLVAATAMVLRDAHQARLVGAFAAGLVLVGGVGLVDDHRPLSAWIRLFAHGVAALLLASVVLDATAAWPLAIVTFVAAMVLTNVWNFMDGINGLAATQAIIVATALGVAASASNGSDTTALIAAALAAACVGFLPYNFPRARIFLGDVGSGSIGYAVAALGSLTLLQHEKLSWLLLLPLSGFLVDSGLTMLRRMIRCEAWWTPHSQHAYQVWARRSGHTRVTLAYAGWTAAGVGLMLAGRGMPAYFMLYIALAWYTTAGLLWWWLQRMENEVPSSSPGPGKDT